MIPLLLLTREISSAKVGKWVEWSDEDGRVLPAPKVRPMSEVA